jgi:hypothetical protein
MLKTSILFSTLFAFHFLLFVPHAFPQEPSLRELERAAIRYSGSDPEEVQHWKFRSRWSAALPHLLVGYDQKAATQVNNNIQDSISVSSAGVTLGPPQSSFYENDNLNRGFELKASWDLNELLFNRDAIAISTEERHRSIARSQVLEELHLAYFERKRLLQIIADAERLNAQQPRRAIQTPETQAFLDLPSLKIHLEELEARLDALTGGAFSKIAQGADHEK